MESMGHIPLEMDLSEPLSDLDQAAAKADAPN
jgi:hypothetical protein